MSFFFYHHLDQKNRFWFDTDELRHSQQYLLFRVPLNSANHSTWPATTTTWRWTALSTTSATFRNSGRTRAGGWQGPPARLTAALVWISASIGVSLTLQVIQANVSLTTTEFRGCPSTRCAGTCAVYPSGAAQWTSSLLTCPSERGDYVRSIPSRHSWSTIRGQMGHCCLALDDITQISW